MDRVDCIVVGAGIVGLAVARAVALRGREVVVLEAGAAIGTGVSSRNSEVIHAGLYYEPNSLKARLCVRGKAMLYAYCDAAGVPYRRTGKLIVATAHGQEAGLRALQANAAANGVQDLQSLNGAKARALEPGIGCVAALLSPSSGIVDSQALMSALLGDAEAKGALLALRSPFGSGRSSDGRWVVATGGESPYEVETHWLVNCAGLHAQSVAQAIDGFSRAAIPPQRLAKGHYFALSGRSPFSRLVYPLPSDGGLGVHLTLDLGGQARFGPDVEWLPAGTFPDLIDFQVDAARSDAFYAEIRRYWKDLPDGALQPAYAGVRPKLSGPGEPSADFRIEGPRTHRCAGLVHLFGIESPGLTAALAIGEHVASIVDEGDAP